VIVVQENTVGIFLKNHVDFFEKALKGLSPATHRRFLVSGHPEIPDESLKKTKAWGP
jgi:hypothetical protein